MKSIAKWAKTKREPLSNPDTQIGNLLISKSCFRPELLRPPSSLCERRTVLTRGPWWLPMSLPTWVHGDQLRDRWDPWCTPHLRKRRREGSGRSLLLISMGAWGDHFGDKNTKMKKIWGYFWWICNHILSQRYYACMNYYNTLSLCPNMQNSHDNSVFMMPFHMF